MTEKHLGKIDSVEFGTIKDYPFDFQISDKTWIGDIGRCTVNILKDAKVNYVSELINKPVEVTIENNTFKDFQILTEVL